MKELSIEEKAKAYDEALERARDYKNNIVHKELTVGESIMDYVFPELAESEDEKIRKELLDLCKDKAEKYSNDPKYKNISAWIAWLEKQGKQKVNYTTLAETGNGGINALVTRELSTNGYSEQKSANEVEPKFKKD